MRRQGPTIEYPQALVQLLMLIGATEGFSGHEELRLVDAEAIPTASSRPLTRTGWEVIWSTFVSAWPDHPRAVAAPTVSRLLVEAGMDREEVADWLSAHAPTKLLASSHGRRAWSAAVDLERELASGRTIGVLPLVHQWSHYTDGGDLLVSAVTRAAADSYRDVLRAGP